MAETYGIFDYKERDPSLIATLTVGLPDTSRVKRKYSGINLTTDQMLLAMLIDCENISIWQRGGAKKSRKPKSIFKMLTEKKKPKDELMSFSSSDEFDEWLARKQEIYNG